MKLEIVFVAFLANSIYCATLSEKILFRPQSSVRIAGGTDAKPGSAPYQVSVQLDGSHLCGGVIIDEKWIVTSGKCAGIREPSRMRILTGTQKLSEGGKYYYIDEIFIHSLYQPINLPYDIALIRLNSSIEFNNLTQPIEYSWEQLPNDAVLTMTGWGTLSYEGFRPDNIQTLDVKRISNEECQKILEITSYHVDIGNVCTLNKPGEGTCTGDIGGPLTYKGKLVALVNWFVSDLTCGSGFPDVHASIAYYHDFIRTTINSN